MKAGYSIDDNVFSIWKGLNDLIIQKNYPILNKVVLYGYLESYIIRDTSFLDTETVAIFRLKPKPCKG